ncbi:CAP domain-containing protein [Crepidotus variabilis]|uniref:CAP domain-containing protein n=1 Tax=Crepidotus variabilis TaxID=179855 RepID=A0A9P6JMJ8_9AGAR|nr:CAP domain-containing protein [Crepidotus variabilis]
MYLDAHNSFRAKYHAPALTWNATLASKALEWSSKCVFEHSGGKLGPYGENLAAGTGGYSIADGIKGWTDESSSYDPNNPTYSHFTQVVWKSTTELGCAYTMCPDGSIFKDGNYGPAKYIVCEYFKQGNVVGQTK